MTDKNGRRIFKGDILRKSVGDKGVIKFGVVPENLGWNGVSHIAFYVEWDRDDLRPDLPYWLNCAEVIGTIFDKEAQND